MGRQRAIGTLDEILGHLKAGDVRAIGGATERNFRGPIQTIIPWACNLYTDRLIEQARAEFGEHFWGFWMLGGMSGGGMGFLFDPRHRAAAKVRLQEIMDETKGRMENSVPFAMQPVVYDFAINERGTWAELHGLAGGTRQRTDGVGALLPADYYRLTVPDTLRQDPWPAYPCAAGGTGGFRGGERRRSGSCRRSAITDPADDAAEAGGGLPGFAVGEAGGERV